jgi:hypothetical protein
MIKISIDYWMKRDILEDHTGYRPISADKLKVTALWTLLHSIKKSTPTSPFFWVAQYIVVYTQFLLWPITLATATQRWKPVGLFTVIKACAKLICGTDFPLWMPSVVLALAFAVLHCTIFVLAIFYTPLRQSKVVALWLGIYFSLTSYSFLMIVLSKSSFEP